MRETSFYSAFEMLKGVKEGDEIIVTCRTFLA